MHKLLLLMCIITQVMHARMERVCSVMLFMLSSFIVDASVEISSPNNERTKDAIKRLTYAEVGLQQEQNKQADFLNLDHVEYAQLKHQPDTITDKQLQPLVENTPIDMCKLT